MKTIWNPLNKSFWEKDNLLGTNKIKNKSTTPKEFHQIKEIKNTCVACGNVWFYGKQDIQLNKSQKMENAGTAMQDVGKSMMCCTGCVPALFIPTKQTKQVKDLNKCDNCGSSAVEQEEVIHNVK